MLCNAGIKSFGIEGTFTYQTSSAIERQLSSFTPSVEGARKQVPGTWRSVSLPAHSMPGTSRGGDTEAGLGYTDEAKETFAKGKPLGSALGRAKL